eukprot:TRINITY_DN6090_c0_g1_i1.p1 TRINITY_DN6090_c0_g1~~TRINITY_DN6090_c0_g1_i1.p1  ORF type:complete len:367 (-),score=59.34 TRINITY_DN6090_c0_g1_i1:77-1024(-)
MCEEKGTPTPRTGTSDSCEQSSTEHPAIGSDAGDEADSEDEDSGSYAADEEYYAFLREMAGSFEATFDEDESEDGSEDEAGGEDEGEEPPCRKRSSSLWLDEDERNGLSPSPHPAAWWAHQSVGLGGEKDDKKDGMRKPLPKDTSGASIGGHPVSKGKERPSAELGGTGRSKPNAARLGSGSTSVGSPRSPSEGNISEVSDAEDGRDDSRCPLVPTPAHDTRGPVIDDYDVVKAVEQFASHRFGDAREQQREDLRAAIKLKYSQAKQLLGSAQNPHTTPQLRAHYSKVRQEILAEASSLENSLTALGTETLQGQP